MARILIIDDERAIRSTLRDILEFEKFEIDEAADGKEALQKIADGNYDLALCDVKMPEYDGIEVLERAREQKPDLQFIMISGHSTIETAVEATRKGAFDFIEKPPDLNRLMIAIRNALDKTQLVTETRVLRKKVAGSREMVGKSATMESIRESILRVAPTDARVLITGENGTGKELVARMIHENSRRQGNGPMVEVNCAAIPSELIESELFGHEKGSFTSALKQRIGKFEQAQGGTLFLDEIGDMSLSAQAKVLRALQESRITRVGGEKDITVDIRVLAATNKDLQAEIVAGRFREDLYHRLSVVIIETPPLRARRDDVPRLAEHFLQEICDEYKCPVKKLTPEAAEQLMNYDWPGNVRELRNVVERLVIFSNKEITGEDVRTNLHPRKGQSIATTTITETGSGVVVDADQFEKLQDFRDHAEKEFILKKLAKHNWNVTKTAEEIDIQRSHLYNKIEKYGLQRQGVVE
jgi:two-component system, NtrC family, nitrogen regulation response regulator NtrX